MPKALCLRSLLTFLGADVGLNPCGAHHKINGRRHPRKICDFAGMSSKAIFLSACGSFKSPLMPLTGLIGLIGPLSCKTPENKCNILSEKRFYFIYLCICTPPYPVSCPAKNAVAAHTNTVTVTPLCYCCDTVKPEREAVPALGFNRITKARPPSIRAAA